MRKVLILTAMIAIAGLALCQQASAGQFTMKQCRGDASQTFSGAYSPLASAYVDVAIGCDGSGESLGVYQDRSNRRIPFGGGGQFYWYTSGGNQIIETSITGKLNSRNGMAARLLGSNISTSDISLDVGSDHTGNPSTSHWNDPGNPITTVVARLMCQPEGGCENNSGSQKAYFELTDIEFEAQDTRLPTVSNGGQLKSWSEDGIWHRGSATYSVGGFDQGSGVSRTYLKVNGSRLDSADANCPGARTGYATSFKPCPENFDHQGTIETSFSPFQEGVNRVQFCVEDYSITASAGTPVCTPERWVLVDNIAPERPNNLTVVGGSDWRSTNGFDLQWSNPTGQNAPIVVAQYSIFDDEQNLVLGPTVAIGSGINSLNSIQVPSPGEYTASVRLIDATGNVGQPSSATLRFDDGRPGNVSPENNPGWVSADELPLDQTIERAEAGGPSGVDGYAVSVSKSGPESPCPSGTCEADDLAVAGGQDDRTVTIADLSEGNHWITTVAASGAGLASEAPESIEVQVDKTDPTTTLQGVPNDWVNHPVTVVATAADDASGMVPQPGGDPVTVIEPADQSPYTAPGPTARFTIASEGTTAVRYWARDLAGNANDGSIAPDGDRHRPPGSATIRIDTTAPSIEFVTQRDPADPEVVTAKVGDRDSGVKGGQIYYRKAGSDSAFTPVDSILESGRITARLPSDDMEKGAYELKAESTDWAGNSSSATSDSSGSPMVLMLPLKGEVTMTAALMKKNKPVKSMRLKPGKLARVAGRVLTSDRSPAANLPLTVTETFAAGSRQANRTTSVRTDVAGEYQLNLGKGPMRSIEVAFGGSPTLGKAASPVLKLGTYDRTSLRVGPRVIRNGGTVKMSGRVLGPGGLSPSGGKLIAIQYYDPSRAKWRPAEVLRTNRSGKYFYRYRFRTITSAQRILFRTASLPEAGWPFIPSTSKPKSVIVYPRTGS